MSVYSIEKLMAETRRLAAEYRRATGKTLPVSAEIAVYDAGRLLKLDPAPPGAGGCDASRHVNGGLERIQIKGRVIFDESNPGYRLGQLKAEQNWDKLILVLMDDNYEAQEIFEADRQVLLEALSDTKDSKRASRGAISVARFKILGRLVWSREHGLEDDGYWDNKS
jgi:hypothetical protein